MIDENRTKLWVSPWRFKGGWWYRLWRWSDDAAWVPPRMKYFFINSSNRFDE